MVDRRIMALSKTKIAAEKRTLLKLCYDVLDDRKAEQLVLLDVREQSSITDYFVIATATSDPHLRAMRGELTKAFKDAKVQLIGVDAEPGSGWVVIDAFDVMVHLFTAQTRDFYRLENLWKDAAVVEPSELEPQKRRRATSGLARKTPVKKKAAKKAPMKKKAVKKAVKKAPARKKAKKA